MNEVYTITSDSGDEYKLQFTTDRSGVIADALLNFLESKGIEVVEIGLARVKGQNVTNHHVLGQIEECVADLLRKHQNVILSFFVTLFILSPRKREYLYKNIAVDFFLRCSTDMLLSTISMIYVTTLSK